MFLEQCKLENSSSLILIPIKYSIFCITIRPVLHFLLLFACVDRLLKCKTSIKYLLIARYSKAKWSQTLNCFENMTYHEVINS